MSVRVNLLPREFEERGKQRRVGILAGAGVLLFAVMLAALVFVRQGAVNDAVTERNEAQADVNAIQAEVTALGGFQALLDQQQAGNALVVAAMGEEIGVARILNDVALTLPTTSSLTSLTLSRNQDDAGAVAQPGQVDFGGQVASLLLSGYSIERYAPGVEGVLLQFEDISGLDISYLNQAARADISDVPVTSFDASGFLDSQIYTGRYADGMPEEAQ